MIDCSIDFVELGFRFLKKNPNFGKYAFISEKLISSLKIPKKLKIAIMINGIEYFGKDERFKEFFINSKKSQISMIRIAINFNE